jgi:hypothetical protein
LRLALAAGLIHRHGNIHGFQPAPVARSTHRRGAEVIQPDGNPDMGVGGADSVGRIEADPAEVRNICLGPGVAGLLVDDAIGTEKMPGDKSRRNAGLARA